MEAYIPTLKAAQQLQRPSMLAHHLFNLLAALIFGILAYFVTWPQWQITELSWKTLFLAALTVRNFSFSLLFLCRRPARMTSGQIKEWVAAIVGTFIGFLYNSNESYSLFAVGDQSIIYIFLSLAMVLCVSALLSLGRSFGIMPANRGIKTTGFYAIVRHPIYACYIIFDLLFLTLRLSWFNQMIFMIFLSATYLRAMYEEGLLRNDPAYQVYSRQTPYMFFPGLL